MKRLHIVPTLHEANGVFQVAQRIARRDGDDLWDFTGAVGVAQGHAVETSSESKLVEKLGTLSHPLSSYDEIWVHGMWLPSAWRSCHRALRAGVKLVRMPHGSLSPIYLERQSKWKKRLVAPIERYYYNKASRVVVSGEWEADWCHRWGVTGEMEILDFKQFFRLDAPHTRPKAERTQAALRVLYLGMEHPLKGVNLLRRASEELNDECWRKMPFTNDVIALKTISDASGDYKESLWRWADVLCLPTFSENFGLVVAEAIEHGCAVITTDGAPAWADLGLEHGLYIRGYKDASESQCVKLLKDALKHYIDQTNLNAKEVFS